MAYVGNMAWAHIKAYEALQREPEVGGRAYFITDDTPIKNSFYLMEPFLSARGYQLSARPIPYSLVYGLLYVTEWALWLLQPLKKINLSTCLCSIVYINMSIYFNSGEARRRFGYEPIYSSAEAHQRSLPYYKTVEL